MSPAGRHPALDNFAGVENGAPTPVVHANLTYLPVGRAETLDAYVPDEGAFPGPRPAVLLIHGGGWRGGDKADARERSIAATLCAHGYLVVSINYLLNTSETAPDGTVRHTTIAWPRNFEDCEAALAWLETVGSARFRAAPGRIAAFGSSAGGQLALLLAARHPHRLRAVVSFYGIGLIEGAREAVFAGATPADTAARARAASPAPQLGAEAPPIFLVHGAADALVPVAHARWMAAEFCRRGLRHSYLELPDAPHSFDLQPAQRDLRPVVLDFLSTHL